MTHPTITARSNSGHYTREGGAGGQGTVKADVVRVLGDGRGGDIGDQRFLHGSARLEFHGCAS